MGESGGEEEVGKDRGMNGREGRKERKKGRGSWECALTVLGFGWEKKGIVSNHLLVGKSHHSLCTRSLHPTPAHTQTSCYIAGEEGEEEEG